MLGAFNISFIEFPEVSDLLRKQKIYQVILLLG